MLNPGGPEGPDSRGAGLETWETFVHAMADPVSSPVTWEQGMSLAVESSGMATTCLGLHAAETTR